MFSYVEQIKQEYCVQIASQKRAVLQKLAKVQQARHATSLCSHSPPLTESFDWALIDDISQRSHTLFRKGTDLLCRVESEESATDGGTSVVALRFNHLLQAFLTDAVAFDLMMQHWKASNGTLSSDAMKCYSHAVVSMPSLGSGTVVDSFLALRHV